MNTEEAEKTLSCQYIYDECLIVSNSDYKKTLVSYYDVLINAKICGNKKQYYVESKHIICRKWKSINKLVQFLSKETDYAESDIYWLFRFPDIVRLFDELGWKFDEIYNVLNNGLKIFKEVFNHVDNVVGGKKFDNQLDKFKIIKKELIGKKYNFKSFSSLMFYIWIFNLFEISIEEYFLSKKKKYSFSEMIESNDGVKFMFTCGNKKNRIIDDNFKVCKKNNNMIIDRMIEKFIPEM